MTRVGIIGYGIMGQLHHQACNQHGSSEVVAVCNRSAGKLEQARDKGVKETFQDYRQMLEQVALDVVIVALPDRLHYQTVVDSLKAGCDVLVEKPMSTSLSEAIEMRSVAQETGQKLMTNFSFRWEVDFQQLKNSIDQGALGEISYMYLRISDSIVVPLQWLPWAAESSPTEFLFPHSIDLARWLLGQEVTKVYASRSEGVLRSKGVDTHDVMVAICEMSGGTKLCLESSWILPETHPTLVDFCIEAQGSAGAARLDRKETGICMYTEQKAERPITWLSTLPNGKGVGFFYESVANFLDWISGSVEQPMSSMDDGVRSTAVLEAVLKSAETGNPVNVSNSL